MRYGSAAQGSLGSSLHQIFSHFTLCPIAAGPTANGLGCGRGSCSHVTCPFPATYPQGAHPRHARQESVAKEDRHAPSTFGGETAETLHPLPRKSKQTERHPPSPACTMLPTRTRTRSARISIAAPPTSTPLTLSPSRPGSRSRPPPSPSPVAAVNPPVPPALSVPLFLEPLLLLPRGLQRTHPSPPRPRSSRLNIIPPAPPPTTPPHCLLPVAETTQFGFGAR